MGFLSGLFGKKRTGRKKSGGLHVSRPVTHRSRKGGVTTTKRGLFLSMGKPDPKPRRRRRSTTRR
jgi:hypothetical protein